MSYQEAVDRGYDECRARRLECRLQNANLSHNHGVWKVRMRAAGPRRKGHLFLEYDAHSRRLLRTDAKIRPWRRATPPRWDHDDDWDDDNDGIPNRKDTGGPQRGNSHGASPVRPGKSASNPKGASTPKQASPPKKQDRHDDDDD